MFIWRHMMGIWCVALILCHWGGFHRSCVGKMFFYFLILHSKLSADRSECGCGVVSCTLNSLHALALLNAPAQIICRLLDI